MTQLTRIRSWLTVLVVALPLALAGCAPASEEYADEEIVEDELAEAEEPGLDDEVVEPEPVAAYAWDWEWGIYDDWDADEEVGLDETEFDERFADVYTAWDVNDDDLLGWDEFETATYGWWDVDDDDLLAAEEWDAVTTRWTFDDYTWGDFATYDVDGDGYLGTTEYQELFNEEAWNGVWDADGDGVVGADEAADTFWDLFDGDDDNLIDENEWGTWAGGV